MVRRVVTGHDSEGRSMVVSDGMARAYDLGRSGSMLFDIWRTTQTPAPILAVERDPVDVPLDFEINERGVRIRMLDIASPEPAETPYMHRTESIDYGLVLEGEMCMILDKGEVCLKAGDFIIQRGTNHAWTNRSGRRCRMLFIMIGGQFSDEIKDVGEKFSPAALSAFMTKG
jgi:hypothetical protein